MSAKQNRLYGCGCKGSNTVKTTVQTPVPATNQTTQTVPTVQPAGR